VFEGATAEINAFLSIASKAAALALLVRVAIGIGTLAPESFSPGQRTAAVSQEPEASSEQARNQGNEDQATGTLDVSADKYSVLSTQYQELATEAADQNGPQSAIRNRQSDALGPVRSFTAKLIAFFAVVTCTFGNLAAYGQTNIKRLLAYSTIAHAGYMMMPVSAAVAMVGINNFGAEKAIASLAIYMAVYLFMNLAAFACVAFLRNTMRTEEIADYAGLVRRSPLTVVCFALTLFGLIGLPPLSGFIGKFAIFAALVDGWQAVESAGQPGFYLLLLLLVGGLNTAISLFYYLRVVKVMTIDDEPADRPRFAFSDVSLAGAFLWLITLPTALLIVSWDWLNDMTMAAARNLLS
jgi:NADH-quinone oxidoreductase subunit N